MTDRQLRSDAIERAYRDHADDVYRLAHAILRDPDGGSWTATWWRSPSAAFAGQLAGNELRFVESTVR